MKRTFFFRLRWFRLCGVGPHFDSVSSKMPLRMLMFDISSWLTVPVFSTFPNNKPKKPKQHHMPSYGPVMGLVNQIKTKTNPPLSVFEKGTG